MPEPERLLLDEAIASGALAAAFALGEGDIQLLAGSAQAEVAVRLKGLLAGESPRERLLLLEQHGKTLLVSVLLSPGMGWVALLFPWQTRLSQVRQLGERLKAPAIGTAPNFAPSDMNAPTEPASRTAKATRQSYWLQVF